MTYAEAQVVAKSRSIRRPHWDANKNIRAAKEEDVEYIGDVNIEGLMVEDCVKPMDCKIGIFAPTHGDRYATDWEEA